jgi:putative nucleotidyltransferase with HDIG domain
MLKKITTDQLRPGMYVAELCSNWIDSPFWQKSFLLADFAAVQQIRAAAIQSAWIDTDKGRDVSVAEVIDTDIEVDADATPDALVPLNAVPVSTSPADTARVSMGEEIARAARIVATSRHAVFSMFQEARMGRAVAIGNAMPLVEEISASVSRNPGALIGLARLKTADDYTYMHSVAVCALMIALGRQLGLDESAIHQAGMAGLLHDIGKMAVAPGILQKPGKLTDAEFTAVKDHPVAGLRLLDDAQGVSEMVRDVCLHHHEKMDGSGYPHGLVGQQISLHARMGAVCDVYDAITSNRPYKSGWCPAESLKKMAEWTPSHFDPVVFQAFVKSIGIYPVGTLVRLASGRLGVVVEQQVAKSLLLPIVRVFFSSKSKLYIAPQLLDLSAQATRDSIVSREDAAKWGLKDIDRFWVGEPAA